MAAEILADDRALRTGRRERVVAQMHAHDLDILVVGRQANVRYVSGATQLWVAGTRPFAPNCVLTRETGEIHLLSTWDEGIPDDIPHDHLYGIAWNPMNIIAVLKEIDGARTARRVGIDALSPGFAALLPIAFPNAELVDAEAALRTARRIKTDDEITSIREALSVAEVGLAAAVSELQPGVSDQRLTGILLEAMAAGGVSTPATQDGAWVTSPEYSGRRAAGPGVVKGGDLVAFAAGVLDQGYTGEVGRTWPVGPVSDDVRALYRRSEVLRESLVAACRPGSPAVDLLTAYEAVGEPLPLTPVAHGLGLGFDPPVVSEHLHQTNASEPLEPGMILAVTNYVWAPGLGAVFGRDAILITDDGPEVLTQAPWWKDTQ